MIYENEGPEDDESDKSKKNDSNDELLIEKSKKIETRMKFIVQAPKKMERSFEILAKICIICLKDSKINNEYISFRCLEDFLKYLKKIYDDEEICVKESEEYKNNKNGFNNYFNNNHLFYSQDYKFKKIKSICKSCFYNNLSIKNGFNNLFTALHVSVQNPITILKKKEEIVLKQNSNIITENKNINKEITSNIFGVNIKPSKQIDQVILNKNIDNNNNEIKLNCNLISKNNVKMIENNEKIEYNEANTKNNNISMTSEILNNKISSTKNNCAVNPKLKLLTIPNQNTNNNQLVNNTKLLNIESNPSFSQLQNQKLGGSSSNLKVSPLVNIIQSLQSNAPQPNINNANVFQGLELGNNAMNSVNQKGQLKSLNYITSNIGNLVEIISQYNQKHLTQNASMITNLNNLVNTMSNIMPGDDKATKGNGSTNDLKIENAHHDSMKENSGEKNESKGDNLGDTLSNENLINVPLIDDKKDLSSLLFNIDNSKNNLSSYMFSVLDELKKQIYSIQYYSLVQKLFISYIFKNLDIFIEQLANNQALNNLTSNNFMKGPILSGMNEFGDNMSSLSEQLTLLKKIAEDLANNQITNPMLNTQNLDEISNAIGGSNSINQLFQLVNGSLNQNPNTSTPNVNVNSMHNMNNNNNSSILNNLSGNVNVNNLKTPLQGINKIFKNENYFDLTNNNINMSTNSIQNNNSDPFSGNNMLDQLLLKGTKNQQIGHSNNQIPIHQSTLGQIIMPINIESNTTKIIQNSGSQIYNFNNNIQNPENFNSLNNMNNSNISNHNLYMHLKNLVSQTGNYGQGGFGQNNFLSNQNLMNLLLNQNNISQNNNNFPSNNSNNNQKF